MSSPRLSAPLLLVVFTALGCDDAAKPEPAAKASAAAPSAPAAKAAPQPSASGAAAADKGYSVEGLSFDSPVPLPKREKVGTAAPAIELSTEDGKLRVLITKVPPGLAKAKPGTKEHADEVQKYGRGTFLGNAKPAESTQKRTVLGKESAGDVVKTSIPKKATIEAHVLQVGDNVVFVGFWYEDGYDKAESIISGVLGSLKGEAK